MNNKPVSNRPRTSVSGSTGVNAKKKKKKLSVPAVIIISITAVLLVVVLVLGGLVIRKYARIQAQQEDLNNLYPDAVTETTSGSSGGSSDGFGQQTDIPEEPESEPIDTATGILPSFEELHKINSDVIGFVKIPGTRLSTPVVQGQDNSYYLNHDYYKQNALGIPFADANATITPDKQSLNVTIYGHSAKDGSYFAPLKDYNSLEFYQKYPLMTFDTIYGKGTYKIVGAFLAKVKTKADEAEDPEWFNYHSYIDMTNEEFDTFVKEMNKRTFFNTDVDLTYGDQLVTLSTCDTEIIPSGDTPYRMVVVARKVRANETTQVDTSKATANKEMVMPKAWQDKYGKANPYK